VKPSKVLLDFRGVYDQEVRVWFQAVKNEVVDHSAAFIQEKGVLAPPVLQLANIVCEQAVEPRFCIWSTNKELAHVGDEEVTWGDDNVDAGRAHKYLEHSGIRDLLKGVSGQSGW
jgi:hypothetical protein